MARGIHASFGQAGQRVKGGPHKICQFVPKWADFGRSRKTWGRHSNAWARRWKGRSWQKRYMYGASPYNRSGALGEWALHRRPIAALQVAHNCPNAIAGLRLHRAGLPEEFDAQWRLFCKIATALPK